jgi:hypothetical protein
MDTKHSTVSENRNRNISRKLDGSVTSQGARRISTNQELRELHKAPDLVAEEAKVVGSCDQNGSHKGG